MPEDAFTILERQLHNLVSSSSTGLTIGAAVSVLFAIWSASKGSKATINGIAGMRVARATGPAPLNRPRAHVEAGPTLAACSPSGLHQYGSYP